MVEVMTLLANLMVFSHDRERGFRG